MVDVASPIAGGGGWSGAFDRAARATLRRAASELPLAPPPFWKGQLIAVGCVAAGAALRKALEPLAHDHIPIIIFYPCVLVASVFGGVSAGLTALVLGAVIARLLWLPASGNEVTLVAYGLVSMFGVAMARLFRTLVEIHVEGEQRAVLLTNEINHRANNLLSVVQAISAQTARAADTVIDYRQAFEARLSALARAHHLVARDPAASPDLRCFILSIIEPFGHDRFEIEGTTSALPHVIAASCALLLHELATNAVKYGALSQPEGRVSIAWRPVEGGVRLEWRETGGPPVRPPARAGFGSRLVNMAFRPEQGRAALSFEPDGVRCVVEFSASR